MNKLISLPSFQEQYHDAVKVQIRDTEDFVMFVVILVLTVGIVYSCWVLKKKCCVEES